MGGPIGAAHLVSPGRPTSTLKQGVRSADMWGMRTSSPMVARRFRNRLARLRDEEGFTLVEAMAALAILAIGIFAAAQALTAGLVTTGLSRQRLAARSALD